MYSKGEKYFENTIEDSPRETKKPPKSLPGFLRRSLWFSDVELDDISAQVSSHSSEAPLISLKHKSTNKTSTIYESLDSTIQNLNLKECLNNVTVAGRTENEFPLNPHLSDGETNEFDLNHANNKETNEKNINSMGYFRSQKLKFTSTGKKKERNMRRGDSSSFATFLLDDQTIFHDTLRNKKSYKEVEFEKVLSSPIVNISDLRRLGWNGIPTDVRSQAWKLILGYLPSNSARRKQTLYRKRAEYREAISQHYDIDDNTRTNQEQETLRQVLVDVPRTAPDIALFRNDRIRYSLTRLLYIWAMRHPASSYVQGINDLATPLIAVFLSGYFDGKDVLNGNILDNLTNDILDEVEADVYWCLTNLLAGIQDHYTSDQPGVQRMVMRLEELVNRIDSNLSEHLRKTGIEFMQFAFKWMNCLLLREFHLRTIIRLWDTYLSEGDGGFERFHVYVCASFLCQFSAEVQKMEFDELFGFMQNIPTSDWGDNEIEILLSQAYVLSTLFHGSDAHLTSHK